MTLSKFKLRTNSQSQHPCQTRARLLSLRPNVSRTLGTNDSFFLSTAVLSSTFGKGRHAATIRGRLLFICARARCGYYSRAATIRCAATI